MKTKRRILRVLVGCETSGVVRHAFRELGHDAWSCDLLPAEDGSPFHIQADHDLDLIDMADNGTWDLGIFHPPCTRLANSGVLRLYRGGKKRNGKDPDKWEEMKRAARFFLALWNCKIPRVAIENPVQHGHAIREINLRYRQTIQPFEFGHPESKRTCLWLRGGLPPLVPTKVLRLPKRGYWDNQTPSGQNKLSPSKDRAAKRARTYPGIADAMAEQWSAYILDSLL